MATMFVTPAEFSRLLDDSKRAYRFLPEVNLYVHWKIHFYKQFATYKDILVAWYRFRGGTYFSVYVARGDQWVKFVMTETRAKQFINFVKEIASLYGIENTMDILRMLSDVINYGYITWKDLFARPVKELVEFVREKFGYITLKKVFGEPNIIVTNLKAMKELTAEVIPKVYAIDYVAITEDYVKLYGVISISPYIWDFDIVVTPSKFQIKPAKFFPKEKAPPEVNTLAQDAWNLISITFNDLRSTNAKYLALAKGFIKSARRVAMVDSSLDPR
jgi:hypothetical protein